MGDGNVGFDVAGLNVGTLLGGWAGGLLGDSVPSVGGWTGGSLGGSVPSIGGWTGGLLGVLVYLWVFQVLL